MTRIVKTDLEDKPFKLLVNPNLVEFYRSCNAPFEQTDIEDIFLSGNQKTILSTRSRGIWFTCYMRVDVFKLLIETLSFQFHYAYCVHDCDIYHDDCDGHTVGELKKYHVHCLLLADSPITLSVVAYTFHTTVIQPHSDYDISNRWNYLIHDSETCRKAHKFQYSPDCRICDDEEYFKSRCVNRDSTQNALDMYDDIVRGLRPRELIKKYGFSYVMNYKNFRLIINDYNVLDLKSYEEDN